MHAGDHRLTDGVSESGKNANYRRESEKHDGDEIKEHRKKLQAGFPVDGAPLAITFLFVDGTQPLAQRIQEPRVAQFLVADEKKKNAPTAVHLKVPGEPDQAVLGVPMQAVAAEDFIQKPFNRGIGGEYLPV